MCIHSSSTNNPSPQCWSAAWLERQLCHLYKTTVLSEDYRKVWHTTYVRENGILDSIFWFNTNSLVNARKDKQTDPRSANGSLVTLSLNRGYSRSDSQTLNSFLGRFCHTIER